MKKNSSTVEWASRPPVSSSCGLEAQTTALLLALCLTLPAPAVEPANPPSKIENAVKEADLPLLKITSLAEQRLGLKTAKVESKKLPETRAFPAGVLIPLAAPDAPAGLAPLPLGTPDDFRKVAELQAIADGAVAAAKATLTGAELTLTRAEMLSKANAGSERALDDARTQLALANTALATTASQRALLGTEVAAALKSPRRWISVSIAATELTRLDTTLAAGVKPIGDAKAASLPAKPVAAPPSATPAAGTVDLFYEVEAAAFLTGQRVQLDISLKGSEAPRLVLPWSAVLFDPQGGAWVYEQTAPQTFTHRRVSILRVAGTDAVLEAGPPAGATIVITGAAELFGAEFGGFK